MNNQPNTEEQEKKPSIYALQYFLEQYIYKLFDTKSRYRAQLYCHIEGNKVVIKSTGEEPESVSEPSALRIFGEKLETFHIWPHRDEDHPNTIKIEASEYILKNLPRLRRELRLPEGSISGERQLDNKGKHSNHDLRNK